MKTKTFEPIKIDISNMTKEQWLEERRKGIGASDVGAIMGFNPFKSALEVWHEKVYGYKDEEEEDENIAAELGLELEQYLRVKFQKWFQKNHNVTISIQKIPYILQHPEYTFLRVNLDGQFDDPLILEYAVIECKTTNEFGGKQWAEDEIPDSYYLQVQTQLAVTGYPRGYVPYLIGNRKFNVKVIERNEEVIKKIIDHTQYFWNEFVLKKIPPAPDSSTSAAKILDELYPKEEQGKITEFQPSGEEAEMLNKYDKLIAEEKNIKDSINLIKQNLKAKMGLAEIAICGNKKIVWKTQSRPAYTVKACEFRMFKIYSRKGGK